MFLAGKFSYFISELLDDKREEGFYEIERAFSKKEINILERIASEHSLADKDEAERFLGNVVAGNNEYSKIWKKLGNFWHYMLPLLITSALNERFNKHAEF